MTWFEALAWTVGVLGALAILLALIVFTVAAWDGEGEWYEAVATSVVWILLMATFVWWVSGTGEPR